MMWGPMSSCQAGLGGVEALDGQNLPYIQTAKRLNSRHSLGSASPSPTDPDTRDHSSSPETIPPYTFVEAAVLWDIEDKVREAQREQPDPGN